MAEFQRPNSICHFFGNYLNFSFFLFFSLFLSFFVFCFFLKQQWKKPKQIQTWRRVFGDALFSWCLLPTTMPAQAKKSSFLMAVLGFPNQRKKKTKDSWTAVSSLWVFFCVCFVLLKALFLKLQKIQLHRIHQLKKKRHKLIFRWLWRQ